MTGPSPPRAAWPAAAWTRSPLVVGVAVLVLALGAVVLRPEGSGVAAWWPAAGVAVAAAACTTGRRRGAVLIAVGAGILAANLLGGRPVALAVAFTAANVAEAALAARLLSADGHPELRTLPQLARLLGAAGAGALVAGTLSAAGVALLAAGDPWAAGSAAAAAHGAAIVVLVPAVMHLPDRAAPPRRWEVAALWALVVAGTVVVFLPGQTMPLGFLVVAALAGTGLRLGVRAASAQLVAVGVVVGVLSALGGGPFAAAGRAHGPAVTGTLEQLYLGSCAVVVLALAISVAQREAALVQLARLRRFDLAVLEVVNAGVLACDADGNVLVRNRVHRRATGVDRTVDDADGHVLATGIRVTQDGVALPPSRTPMQRALAGEVLTDESLRIEPASGPASDVVAMAGPIHDHDGSLLGAVVAFADVTAERAVQARLRESLAFREAVLAVSPDTLFLFDPRSRETLWLSPSGTGSPEDSPTDLVALGGEPCQQRVHPADVARLVAADEAARGLADGAVLKLRLRIRDWQGRYRWVSRRVTPFDRDEAGEVTALLGVARDITENVELEERLAAAALHDPLTGLPNRRLLADRLETALHRASRTGSEVPVLFCDLDGFKVVNDTAGHAVGDALLQATAARLKKVLRPQDTVARVGGDEFVAVLDPALRAVDPVDARAEVRRQARSVARRIVVALAEPFVVDGVPHAITVSIGITFAVAGAEPEQALRDADRAMYQAKLLGKGRHQELDDVSGQA
ncbi:GGDEF domain-containing protein [Pseudonocardia broussonetiae]|uniref:Diguanylate cyclase n=1 Tax=Pseudonocardia broussonetiae TaxID=2736640 RepID=A0A6M6JNP2_9PSEU|nr:GGDEF domain-containing protein [Pseudonocardia broussonetiae]QJY49558.1 diguanylate cyclase [Pseudonocardia broussonetiae]